MNELKPYVNLITLDRLRELYWCNDAIAHAITMMRHISGINANLEQLVMLHWMPEAQRSLLYGALAAGIDQVGIAEYLAISEAANADDISAAVVDGLSNYLPPAPQETKQEEGDELWPEIKPPKINGSTFFFPALESEFMAYGFTTDAIGRMTLRGMQMFRDFQAGGKSAASWLEKGL